MVLGLEYHRCGSFLGRSSPADLKEGVLPESLPPQPGPHVPGSEVVRADLSVGLRSFPSSNKP